ncbi:amino acid adenylation domain-containing protein/thioester reductase-like protein [Chryseobacterium sp. 52]|uniref:non-ribosomal peptide synthetase n=1 Tax=Chryseobacterium sp. 52 TaxID=2035213 RepID=UPI000C19BD48|nr:non-ribosomal peptide synthetase [Chryseobacterium sp. 52]PIF46130.1 amino acid adenylation domain-containing protein/thioester reductase-like protein [Chryseobacterium sp. 52]
MNKMLTKESTILSLLDEIIVMNANKTALIYENEQITYTRLGIRANQFANYLKQRGIFMDVPLCFCLDQSIEKVIVMLSIWKAGGAYVSLDPLHPETRLQQILEDTNSPVLITTKAFAEKFSFFRGDIILIDEQKEEIGKASKENPDCKMENGLAYLAYTSGSTGIPKAVMAEHTGLKNFIKYFSEFLNLEKEDITLQISSSNFDALIIDLWIPLSAGVTVCLYPDNRMIGDSLLDYICHNKITVLPYLPVSVLATLPTDKSIGSLRKIGTGGEAPIMNVIGHWKKKVELLNLYGPTETTVAVSGFKFDEDHPISTIGKPFQNVDFHVLNDEMKAVPVNETGELYIGGIQVTRGYYNQPKLTAERFIFIQTPEGKTTRVYKTGDLVRRLQDDTLEFIGRADQQVKIRGFRVEPSEIEENIRQSHLVENCIIITKQEQNENQLICFYKDRNSYPEDIRSYLFERLPSHMIPSKFMEVQDFPLTANGKIDKSILKNLEITEEKRRSFTPPQTELQQKLATAWKAILGVQSVGIDDNFFQFGGSSILAYKLVSLIRKDLHISLQITDVFLYPTIHNIENYIIHKRTFKEVHEEFPINENQVIQLSSQQQSLWFIDQLYGSVAYNVGALYSIDKHTSLPALEKAIQQLLKRHTVLRTIIEEKDNQSFQSVISENNWILETLHRTDKINELIKIPIDLQRDYMLRAYAVYENDEPVSLLLIIHHMVTDGWSMPLIIHEINELYHQILKNENSEMANSPVEYKDYILWQSKQNRDNGISFWKNYLEDVPMLHIAHDFKKEQQHWDSGKQYQFEIDENLTQALKKMTEDQSATLYMTLLSSFGLLMQYYSGQNDICIGSPSANRPHHFDKTIGYFANMLPIRMKIEGNPLFSEFLKQIKNRIPQVFQHQETPLETIISHVIKDRFAGHNPLFQNVFVFQNSNEESEISKPIDNEKVEWIFNEKAKFDLQFEVLPNDKTLKINIDYSDLLFKEKSIAEMAEAYQYILTSIASHPDQKIGDIDIHSVLEKGKTNESEKAEFPKTFIELFEEQVKRTPEKTALLLSGMGISYQDLDKKSSYIANQLISSGIKNGDFVACYQEQSINRIITLLGIVKSGAAYVPLDTSYPLDRIKILIEDTQPKFLITSTQFSSFKNEIAEPVLFVEEMLNSPHKNNRASYADTHSPTDLVYIIHTSGTTGTPKGVLIEHRSLANFITEYGNLLDINEKDRTLQFSPYNFDGSVIDLWIPLTKGATVLLYPNNKLLGEHLYEFISLHHISVIPFISPSVLSTIPQRPDLSLKVIGTGGETCPAQVNQYWRQVTQLINVYGPTETTVAVNKYIFDDIHPDNTLGNAIKNMKFYVLDQYHRKVPNGVVGELYISGIQLSRGYLNNPGLTAKKFINNPFIHEQNSIYSRMYKTGDQVKVLSDGMIEYVGRTDHQVKVRGYRIELAEIENILCQIKGIKNATVHVHKASETTQSLRAFVSGESPISHIKSELNKKLPSYMVPQEIFMVESMPVKSNGKIDMDSLNSIAEKHITDVLEIEEEEPANEYERIIKEVWTEVLQRKILNMEDDFFQLGGHSLLLTKLYNKLFAHFPNTISLSELYTNSTIRKLALLIQERENSPEIQNYGLGQDPLSDEIKKDATIASDEFKFNVSKKGNFTDPKAILLTGVTGFVGVNMLIELLQSNSADIYLLIRADHEIRAKERVLETMKNQWISTDLYDEKRIKLLAGDLAKPLLGLTHEKYEELTELIDVVHHAGSSVNFIQPYSFMKAANVDALHTLIQFVTTYKLKQLSLLSTVGVISWEHYFTKPALIMEDTDMKSAFKYLSRDMGYVQSKWVMEQVAQEAIKQGVPIIIFRLGYVFCHSLSGATAKYQWWGSLIKTCIQLKAYPILVDQKEELIMVDFVGKAIAHISKNPDSIGKVFHLSPEPEDNITVMEFFELLRDELDFDLKPIPYTEWRALWENDENSPLYPLLNLFKFVAYDNKSIIEIHQNTPNYDITNTKKFLEGSSIENKTVKRDNVEAFCKYLGVL